MKADAGPGSRRNKTQKRSLGEPRGGSTNALYQPEDVGLPDRGPGVCQPAALGAECIFSVVVLMAVRFLLSCILVHQTAKMVWTAMRSYQITYATLCVSMRIIAEPQKSDSKSAEGNLVGVRPPLPAPIKQRDQVNLASPERRGQNRLVAVDFHWESDHGTFVISQRAFDYLIATRRLPTRRIGGRFSSRLRASKNMRGPTIQTRSFLRPFGLGVIGCGLGVRNGCNWVYHWV